MKNKALCTNSKIEQAMEAYSDMVFRLALAQLKHRANAEDVFQEVFFRFAKADTVFESEEHQKAWFIRVTLNCCRKLQSSAWFRHIYPEDENAAEPIATQEDEHSEVREAVQGLPAKYRSVIHLFYFEDMSAAQIATSLGLKESTITSQLCRARKLLQEKLKGDYDYD
ncbi:MAG: sigma-70 family RNA polymerase sigma factor [Oscillospiraceae bacterium]|jgi:RNA polymerase sigma-70 factor (ECF subfamily)|nr:sigma-70 family RNA polymerase sigma factor [Oscillospiraceae bacterium]